MHLSVLNLQRETSREPVSARPAPVSRHRAAAAQTMPRGELPPFPTNARELARLFADPAMALLVLDRQYRVVSFSDSMRSLWAVSEQTYGVSARAIRRHVIDPKLSADLEAVVSRHESREAEVVSEYGRVYLRLALPCRTTDGGPEGAVLVFVDITRRKTAETALRASEEGHRKILESVPEYAILLLDLEGRFVTWTPSAERILGFSAPEAIGQHLQLIHPPEERSREEVDHQLAQARTGRSTTVNRWHVRKDGSRFWGTGVLSQLNDGDGRLYGYVKLLRDNTTEKRALDTMRRAKNDAEQANSAKEFFLANVSHELRTPLSVMLLWAKFLQRQKRLEAGQLNEALEAIVKSAEEQQALIEDLVDTSRMVAGKMRLELGEVPLRILTRKALEAVAPAAQAKGLRLHHSISAAAGTVRADALRLQQVLTNLLHNAVKFTPKGGRVSLALQRKGNRVEIRVRDTGRGISPEFLGQIFDRFTQADSSSAASGGGLGLGLSIARHLVQLHDGTLQAHSAGLGKGTTFTVRLPLPPLSTRKIKLRSRAAFVPSLQGISILLVEDMRHTRQALVAVLSAAGAQVTAVSSAPEALRRLQDQRPDVLVSDIGLGELSGHDLMADIRRGERRRNLDPLPALALTAYADERNHQQARTSGFDCILTKPVDATELIFRLSRLVKTAP